MKKLFSIVIGLSLFLIHAQTSQAQQGFNDYSIGNSAAPVSMTIYHDFQCPFCAQFHDTISDSSKIDGYIKRGELLMVYKDYPLESIHPNARQAARAANAVLAANRSQYMAYMDILYARQGRWGGLPAPYQTFSDYGKEVGIDIANFEKYYKDPNNSLEIDNDSEDGNWVGVTGTPSFDINGILFSGAQSEANLIGYIEEELALQDVNPVASNNIYESFDILAADYNEFSKEIGIYWETYMNHPDDLPIDEYYLSYDIYDPSADQGSYVVEEFVIPGEKTAFYFNAKPYLEYSIYLEGFTENGISVGGESITLFTTDEPQPFYSEPYAPANTYFINNTSYNFDREEVVINWDKNFASGITGFSLYYDIYDLYNGSFIKGSQVIELGHETESFVISGAEDGYEYWITIDAYDDIGLLATDSVSVFTDQFDPLRPPPGEYLPFIDLDITHNYGNDYYVDLEVGDRIQFEVLNYTPKFEMEAIMLEQQPNKLMDCYPINMGETYECKALRTGDTDVYFTAESYDDNGSLKADGISPAIIVYVSDQYNPPGTNCPVYPPPNCPNGAYYPPAADGCPGQPICKDNTGSVIEPLYGYEDPVITRFPEESNPFTDTSLDNLEGKAAAQLFYMGVIGGRRSGEFDGEALVNRAEAAKFLMLAKGKKIIDAFSESDNPFWDVIVSEWYGPFVLMATFEGVIEGHPDNSFKPADTVITAELLAMLARAFNLPLNLPHNYKDESKYPGAWFWQYAGIAEKYKLFPNRQEFLNPEKPLTRNEVAVAIYQLLRGLNKTGADTSSSDTQITQSPEEVVNKYVMSTVVRSPDANFDGETAKSLLYPDVAQHFDDPTFIPYSYGIQDGPDHASVNETMTRIEGDTAYITVFAYYGSDAAPWEFTLKKHNGEWLIYDYNELRKNFQ